MMIEELSEVDRVVLLLANGKLELPSILL